jgi:hypothetical protein
VSELRALRRLARLENIQLSYVTAAGKDCEASPETLWAILHALGTPIERSKDIAAALEAANKRLWAQPLEPVTVAWQGQEPTVDLHRY